MLMTLAVITSGTAFLFAVQSLVAASRRIDRMLADVEPPPTTAGPAATEH